MTSRALGRGASWARGPADSSRHTPAAIDDIRIKPRGPRPIMQVPLTDDKSPPGILSRRAILGPP